MGRMLGSFADDEDLDRPDLNKCPDCGCFFESDDCPICGKRCPDYMRAGNRKSQKKKKKKRGGPQYKVAFIDWYHSWWFIILMLFFFPLAGIILLITSPHKKGLKITVVAVAALYTILSSIGISSIIRWATVHFGDAPVDTSLSRVEYVTACDEISAEDFYRSSSGFESAFVSMTLRVKEKLVDIEGSGYGDKYTTYYVCEALDGGSFKIMIRDCVQDGKQNLIAGDMIRIYGEGAGTVTIYDEHYVAHSAPCVYVAYLDLIG